MKLETQEEKDLFNRRYQIKIQDIIKQSSLLELNRYVYARYRLSYARIRNPKEHAIPLYTGA